MLLAAVGPAGAATLLSETTWGGPVSEVTEESAVAPDGSTYLAGFTTSFDQFGQGGTVDTPPGTSPGGGGIDAALVRVAP